jgi:thymidylate synthase
MNRIEQQYLSLLKDILDNGKQKTDRTGTGTISVFGRQLRHDFRDGFPLLTTKRMAFKAIVTELLWFLRGETNIKYLVENNCHIWDGDAYKRYKERVKFSSNPYDRHIISSQPSKEWEGMGKFKIGDDFTKEEFIEKIKTDESFAKRWGDLGPIYGKQWRNWENEIVNYAGQKYNSQTIDQIQQLINDLKTNPDSRRLMVNAWNVGELHHMVLPPCHYGFQLYTRELTTEEKRFIITNYILEVKPEDKPNSDKFWGDTDGEVDLYLEKYNLPKRKISLMWNQRSVDTFLGLPFNIASYGLLLMIIAKEVNMIPEELIGNLGDCHLYTNHLEQAREQISRRQYDLPTLKIKGINDNHMIYPKLLPTTGEEEFYEISDFEIENYQFHPTIKAPLSN